MKREIKFRVWDIEKKKFIPTDVYGIITTDFKAFGIMLRDWENYITGEYFYINSQDISQFTGLHDKNNNEIYEGDILKTINNNYGTIVYKSPSFELTVDETQSSLYTKEWLEAGEVISNIYEHPDFYKKFDMRNNPIDFLPNI